MMFSAVLGDRGRGAPFLLQLVEGLCGDQAESDGHSCRCRELCLLLLDGWVSAIFKLLFCTVALLAGAGEGG
jgi:hypothetical protein